MPRSDVYCMDCLEAIKKLPDNAFDLAVVDPPYGDALEHTHTHNCDATAGTDGTSTAWNRFGQRFDRYKTNICQAGGGYHGKEYPALAERGLRSTEKNHRVGRSAETGIL